MTYETDLIPPREVERAAILQRRAAEGWRLVTVDQGIAYWEKP